MNYDHFEREVLAYQGEMRCRAERRRMLRGAPSAPRSGGGHAVRVRVAAALRSVANHLEAHPASL